jgi:amino acid adenylation domain-containing protein/non-ribosomal peptide synthase protein (TIGR01720 family)
LETATAGPGRSPPGPPLPGDAQRRQALEWGTAQGAYPDDRCIHSLFEQQARRTPDATAVTFGGQRLTYDKLNARANHLAHRLRAMGVGPESLVAVSLERSADLVVALLAVLKAGGAYAPLDPTYPEERLRFMLEDTGARVLLTEARRKDRLPPHPRTLLVDADADPQDAGGPEGDPESGATADSLAYVIYTSGSTGQPKGVAVTHRSIARLAFDTRYVPLSAKDRVAQASNASFDALTFEVWSPLVHGACVVGIPQEVLLSPPRLAEHLRREGVTVLFVTTALFNQVVREAPEAFSGLRTLLFGGEASDPRRVRALLQGAPPGRLLHVYGPTECTTFATWHLVEGVPEGATGIPIGRPLLNTSTYVLDPHGDPAPVGTPGELHIGGPGVARGYLNQPALTAERFVPDPFSPEPGARMYRTGDLVRWLPEGAIEFLGRLDQQVKVRGFRIELGEIESALAAHPAVREAAVLAREDTPGQKRLVAYVVPNPDGRAGKGAGNGIAEEHVATWQALFDQEVNPASEPTFDLSGWNSSYTRDPIPAEEMAEWTDATVHRILSLAPGRVLEIGHGTGLLLFRVVPHCTSYVGTDFSAATQEILRARVKSLRMDGVTLLLREARDFSGIQGGAFDTVLVNSVVQYFPDADYLFHVLRQAVEALAAGGGAVFVGDIRSEPLLEAYHASVELARSDPSDSRAGLRGRVEDRIGRENELVVNPAFFLAMRDRIPDISHVEILPKRGRFPNELTRFRYDVVVHVARPVPPLEVPAWSDWRLAGWSLPSLRQRLGTDRPGVLGITDVPNARVQADVQALAWLRGAGGAETAGEFQASLAETGVDPEELWALGQELGYEVQVSWAGARSDGSFHVLFLDPAKEPGPRAVAFPEAARRPAWQDYVNDPLKGLRLRESAQGLVPALRTFLEAKLPPYMVPAAFVPLGALPLTPNGKVDRKALPAPEGRRPDLKEPYAPPRTPAEETLAEVWAEVLRVDPVGIHDHFIELGGDSILAIQVVARAAQKGLRLAPKQIFQHPTIAQLAATAAAAPAPLGDQGLVQGPVPLTPVQRWFFEQDLPRFNQSFLVEVPEDVDARMLSGAMGAVVLHHDALRLRFRRTEAGWRAETAAAGPPSPIPVIGLSGIEPSRRAAALDAEAARLYEGLDPTAGPLVRAALFDLGPGERKRLLVAVHHLVVDGVSWRILFEDLEAAYLQLARGRAVRLPPKTTSFKQWAEGLHAYAGSAALQQEAAYWLDDRRGKVRPLPVDFPDGQNSVASARRVSVFLGEQETRALLQDVPGAYRTQINDALLAALAQALSRWTGDRTFLVDLEGHGREDVVAGADLSRTVGWFTSIFPLLLEAGDPEDPGACLKSAKEQLRALPNRGIGHAVLRHLGDGPAAQRLAEGPRPQVSFNYLGQFDQGFASSGLFTVDPAEAIGRETSLGGRRPWLIDINGGVGGGRLRFDFTYSENLYRHTTVEGLAHGFLDALRQIVAHAAAPGAGGFTPSDFPLAGLCQDDLDALVAAAPDLEDVYPLTPMQEGMLFHGLLAPDARAYFVQFEFTLTGPLDVEAFEQAWRETAARQPALRTSFRWEGRTRPLQVVHATSRIPIERIGWQGMPEAEADERLGSLLRQDRARGFDLAQPPLRLAVIRLADDRHHVVWSFHHAILDGWSVPTVLKEVFDRYEAHREGRRLDLPRVRPYSDYVAWLARQDVAAGQAYWRRTLAGSAAPTPLGVDRPPAAQDAAMAGDAMPEFETHLSGTATAALAAFARQRHVTLSTIVEGAWALLLSRYSGEGDVTFGASVSGRPADLPGVESMVGLFINTLPVRVRVPAGSTVASWLEGFQAQQVEMHQHEHTPLVTIQAASEARGGRPLFDSVLVFENYPLEGLAHRNLRDLSVRGLGFREKTNYTLTVIARSGPRLQLKVAYDASRFEAGAAQRMLGHLRTVLEAMAESADGRVGDLPLLTPQERECLLVEWNATASPYPRDRCIHQVFEAVADRFPDSIAVAFGGVTLTYAELNVRANRLAHRLQRLGVGPGAFVGVLLERCPDAVVALLAILKAGGAYVPLDPEHPPERLRFMAEDARVSVLVTQSGLRDRIPRTDAHVVAIDAEWGKIAATEPGGNPTAAVGPDDAAYVIYTSGSTGVPKGVVAPHRGVVRLVQGTTYVTVAPGDVLLHYAPLAFDASTFEIWGALLNGARLAVAPPRHLSVHELGNTLQSNGVTTLWLTAPLFHLMVDENPDGLAGVRQLLAGGDALSPAHVRKAQRRLPGCRIINGYGPTETVTFACCHAIPDPASPYTASVPIGRPIGNTRAYVLDARKEPVPIDVPGELYVGGDGVALGYLNRPELTAERFLADPFSPEPGARMYRTGDRVRWLPDGTLEFLGRFDEQVKVRGFRVEPGEVQAVLAGHPGVKEAVVAAREVRPGEKALVAYIVPASAPAPTAEELRGFLARSLPDPLLPSAFVVLETLPLTANGKVDRHALPDPGTGRLDPGGAHVAPRTPTEEILAQAWSQVLGVATVGVRDDFFALGGHSLLATQVVSRLRTALGIDVPVRALFDARTVERLARAVDDLRRERAGTPAPPIIRAPRSAEAPLSFAQQRLWFLDRLRPEVVAYSVPLTLRLSGKLDGKALASALGEIARRHEALRTSFGLVDGQPTQKVAPPVPMALETVALDAIPASEREGRARTLARQEAETPFDLVAGPVFRARLLRLAQDDHILLVNVHHIAFDGWSIGNLLRELGALYPAFCEGRPSPLPDLPIQYADFARWQRDWFQGEALERQLAYWRLQLKGIQALELATDRPRPPVQSMRGATLAFPIPRSLADPLRALAEASGATLFMPLLAAYQTLLHRYTGQPDIAVGSPIAGRNRAETEDLIGFFVNTLVLRTDLSGDPTFRQLLSRVRNVCLDAYAHQDLPFERVVEELAPKRDLGRHPLFQVMLTLQDAAPADTPLGALRMTPGHPELNVSKFDLTLSITQAPDGLSGSFEYNTDLFEASTVARMAGHFTRILEGVACDPDRPLSALPLLSDAERAALLGAWAGERRPYPREATVCGLFEARAALSPAAVAVVEAGGQEVTFAEINARANRLAHALMKRKVGTGSRVALCLERSLDSVVSMLAVLKAGAAYVPLEPTYPAHRLRFMLEDSGADALVGHAHLVDRLPAADRTVVRVDADWQRDIAPEPATNPRAPPGLGALSPAYVMYTSGSTGQPKGVVVPHRGIVRLVENSGFVSVGPQDVFLHMAPAAFDASTFEVWMPLLQGARVALLAPGKPSLKELGDALERHRVTVLWLTAPLFHLLVDENVQALRGVRQLLAGGDALSPAHVRRALHALPGTRILNGYGPTEGTTFSCTFALDSPAGLDAHPRSVPIGRPIGNTTAYVLDGAGEPVPVGVPGELHIGGDGLALGYHGQPGLSAERFLPDPFASGEAAGPQARLYRTGDIARWLPDGVLEFLGRLDDQVKIRGFRVEPGEVEAALKRHPEVKDAVVVARGEGGGERRLVAYVVARAQAGPAPAALRELLERSLPDHMVPAAFVLLPAFPLGLNGKVDRAALPAPRLEDPARSAYVAPRTPTETVVASLWARLLRVERVGIHADFFELGGHSLLATQAVSHIREALGVDVPLRAMFESPTVERLSRAIEAARSGTPTGGEEASRPKPDAGPAAPGKRISARRRTGEAPLSFAQQRLWFLNELIPNSHAYNIPVAYRLAGTLDVAALDSALKEIVRRHEVLRTTFSPADGNPVQRVGGSTAFALDVLDLSGLPDRDAQARRLSREDAHRPFDLVRGPVLRARLLKLGPEEHLLTLCFHHIAFDGWSTRVFSSELSALYDAFAAGRPSPLPDLPIQYADFADWQRRWLTGDTLETHLAYWRRQLEGVKALELPLDRPRPRIQTFRGAQKAFELPGDVAQKLAALRRRQGVTTFMQVLAAFQVLLHRYSGQDDIVVGSAIAGRNRAETEGLIGFFVNTLALRTDLSGDPTFRELLRRVKEACLDAYAHEDLPFERIVEELAPKRDLSRHPLFQVMLTLQEAAPANAPGEGLRMTPESPELNVAKFDLTLSMAETPGGLVGVFEYNTDLFEASTVARMAGHFRMLLESIARDPDRPLSTLALLTGPERRQMLEEWNDTRADYPDRECIHHQFEVQADRTPGGVAVSWRGESLTYRELDARANQLAHHLKGMGVGPDTLVALCVERSIEAVVGILGILKAGGAYVPLDPAYPKERLAFMLEDARAGVLVTQRRLHAGLPPHAGRVVCIDEDWPAIAREPASRPEGGASPAHLAYVIYTSGSTGKPKGVLIEHRGLSNLITAVIRVFRAGAQSRMLQLSSLSFDASVWEIFTALLSGARLCIPGEARAPVGLELLRLLKQERVTIGMFTPAALKSLPHDGLPDLQTIVAGGDVCTQELVERWAPQRRFINAYGPTEITVCCAVAVCTPALQAPPPIGRPLANTRIYLLDAHRNPVPVGVPGEIYVGGAGVARGYLNRPELTAERFVADPFHRGGAGARLYRTGDLARYRPDGNLEFLGRADRQVKVRGIRIEPGEIEAALGEHPLVEDAAVVADADTHGDARLVAYLVPRRPEGEEPFPRKASDALRHDLRSFLATRLPESMVPSVFVEVASWPMTPSGKVDRKALPVPERLRSAGPQAQETPRTEVERVVADAWAQLLGVERVGLYENFFDLGGHSLLIPQVQARLTQALKREIPAVAFFEHPTVASLARHVAEAGEVSAPLQTRMARGEARRAARPRRDRPQPAPEGGGSDASR